MLDKDNVLKLQQQQLQGIDYDVTTPGIGNSEAMPRTKQVHSLLLESIEKIAGEWLTQLKTLRENTQTLEALILSHMGRTKSDIDALHELGIKVAAEAARGQAICRELRDGLEKIA